MAPAGAEREAAGLGLAEVAGSDPVEAAGLGLAEVAGLGAAGEAVSG